MNNRIRRCLILFLIALMLTGSISDVTFASVFKEHVRVITHAIFGEEDYWSGTGPSDDESEIKKWKTFSGEWESLMFATAFVADKTNNDGSKYYERLKTNGIRGLTESEESLSTPGGRTHRLFSHMGWSPPFSDKADEERWNKRKRVLLETANQLFDFGLFSGNLFGYHEKCDCLCALLYYLHILEDIALTQKTDTKSAPEPVGEMIPLVNGNNNLDIINELRRILFDVILTPDNPASDYKMHYDKLKNGLTTIEKKANRSGFRTVQSIKTLQSNTPQDNVYRGLAKDVLNLLYKHLPYLLKNEEFFNKVFY